MRVLILSAVLACAVAAPSLAPVASIVPIAPAAVVLPSATPTIDPGDVEAAVINAKVAAEDQARAFNDKVIEENNEKVIEADSLAKEKTEEAFWAGEEKKWQALEEVQTAEAKLDGAVASNADALARSAFGGIVVPQPITYIASPIIPAPLAPLGAPIAPISPLYPQALIPNIETDKNLKEKELVKTAEPEKDQKKDGLEKNEEKKTEGDLKLPLVPLVAPLKLQPWITPVGAVAPVAQVAPLPYGAIAPIAYLPQPILTPVIKTQW